MNVLDTETVKENVKPKGFGVRHTQTIFLFLGIFLFFTMRVNLSMAIVAMVEKDFDWDLAKQGMVLSSYFWGYVCLQIPSGELARLLGGNRLLLAAMAVNAVTSLLLPAAAFLGGWKAVCVCRVLQGLTQASVYPSTHHLISQWVPLEEKGLLSTIIYAGSPLGISCQLFISGFVASSLGWQAIFYANGSLGAIWVLGYMIKGAASPEQSKSICKEEVLYIQRSLGRTGELKRLPTPWRKIMTSLPFWALIVAHCGQNWGFFTLMTETPTFINNVHGVNLKSVTIAYSEILILPAQNGVLSSIPYLAMYVLSFPMGAMTDLIIRRKWLSISNTRKLFNSIGLWGPALAMIGLAYAPENNLLYAEIMLILAVGVNAGQYTGFMLIHTDLAPNFSASLMGITNFIANIVSIIAPLVCGALIDKEKQHEASEWRKVFNLAAVVYICTNLFFILFVTSERQPWNEPVKNPNTDIEDEDFGIEMKRSNKKNIGSET